MIDNVHLFGLKRYLGVDRITPNDLVYGEDGRFPIQINANVRCVKYWLKLMRTDDQTAFESISNIIEFGPKMKN